MNDKLNKMLQSAVDDIEEKERKLKINWGWVKLPMDSESCLSALRVMLNRHTQKKCGSDFVIDKYNAHCIDQVIAYMTGSTDFKGSHAKGLMLIGNFGTGKTTIVAAMCDVYFALRNRIIQQISAVELAAAIKAGTSTVQEFYTKPLFLDEIGREADTVKDYGTEIRPVADVLSSRYARNSLTFATANYIIERKDSKGGLCLEDKYGTYISDRMKEMFNVIYMTGESRRK